MRINSTLLKQFIMISPFSNSIICNHKNLIRIADRRKPVCDRDRGPVLRKLFQALLDPALTLIEILCFCPPDRRVPRSPTKLSYPSGRDMINSWIFAFFAASIISSIDAPGFP